MFFIYPIIFILIAILQVWLCRKKSIYLGLIIPIINIIISTIMAMMPSDFFIASYMLVRNLVPVIIWIAIYKITRNKLHLKKFKFKLKNILIMLLSITILATCGVLYNKNIMSKWTPNKEIIGTWIGKANLSSKLSEKQPNNTNKQEVNIEININKSGNVTGKIGDAKLLDCYIYLNRNSFERFVNVKTDFVIKGGYLKGQIISKDETSYRDISMPFNINSESLKGSMFQIKQWKYPYPFILHMILNLKQ